VLQIAPSTYNAPVAQRIDAAREAARVPRDAALKAKVHRVSEHIFKVYGVRKVWRQPGGRTNRWRVRRLTPDARVGIARRGA
jgi:HD superfamily phosphodiesterase